MLGPTILPPAGGSAAFVGCLSFADRTSLSCLVRSRRNFWWWSGIVGVTFISGTSLVGHGLAKKRAGNSNCVGVFTSRSAEAGLDLTL